MINKLGFQWVYIELILYNYMFISVWKTKSRRGRWTCSTCKDFSNWLLDLRPQGDCQPSSRGRLAMCGGLIDVEGLTMLVVPYVDFVVLILNICVYHQRSIFNVYIVNSLHVSIDILNRFVYTVFAFIFQVGINMSWVLELMDKIVLPFFVVERSYMCVSICVICNVL